mmetsp:Transcript_16470/g.56087  ORF Transcript_16470/g.56087 Transcript_16470/m.56087 type:complete len:230 (-) Transcript_16470:232-921(-)
MNTLPNAAHPPPAPPAPPPPPPPPLQPSVSNGERSPAASLAEQLRKEKERQNAPVKPPGPLPFTADELANQKEKLCAEKRPLKPPQAPPPPSKGFGMKTVEKTRSPTLHPDVLSEQSKFLKSPHLKRLEPAYMLKKGGFLKAVWQKRFFCLDGKRIQWYETKEDAASLPSKGCGTLSSVEQHGKNLSLKVSHETKRKQSIRVYELRAFNVATAKEWADTISHNLRTPSA